MILEKDYDNGVDHYADCDDPLNCNCDNLIQCPKCQGYGIIEVNMNDSPQGCPYCDEGLVLISEYDSIYNSD